MTATIAQREPLSLDLIRWYCGKGWARKRAVTNAQRRSVPILLIYHPEHGFAAVSERIYPRYDGRA